MSVFESDEDFPRRSWRDWKLIRLWRVLMRLADADLPADADIRYIPLGEHDVILIECERVLSAETAERIRQRLGQIWPRHQILVVGEEMRIRVMERSKVEAVAARLQTGAS